MKNFFSSLIIILLFLGFSTNNAKAQKFGHIDSNKLMEIMPDKAQAKVELESFAKGLEEQLQAMQGELQSKYQDYMSKKETLTELIKQTKEQELQDLQGRIQTFQGTAQQELQKKEMELLQPIIQKAQDAIKAVGKEQGLTYVYDIGTGAIVYYSDESKDILDLVKIKLGITE